MAGDPNQEMELPLIVAPRGTYSQPGEFGNSSDLNVAALRFSLPKLEFVNGETLQGRLLIEPHQNFDVREVRLELFCRESVNRGQHAQHQRDHRPEIELAGSMKMQSGQAVSYPFTFIVAPKGRPTFQSPKAQVHWVLKASLDRAFAGDAVVEQELYVYSGARRLNGYHHRDTEATEIKFSVPSVFSVLRRVTRRVPACSDSRSPRRGSCRPPAGLHLRPCRRWRAPPA